MKIRAFIGLFLLLPCFGFSQGEWNNWYFGHNAGITFQPDGVHPLTDCPVTFWMPEVSSTVSDSSGHLLFYAGFWYGNGSHYGTVFNRNHLAMANGHNLLAGGMSDQSFLAVQKLDDDSSYYLFAMDNPYPPALPEPQGLTYSVIDMRLNGGLGDVVAGQKNVNVNAALLTKGMLSGTRHRNNHDVWVVVRNYYNSYSYLSYLVTASGINPNPVYSNSFFWLEIPVNNDNWPIMIRFSPDGTRMAAVYSDTLEYCRFNDQTGQITPLFRVPYNSPYPANEPSAEFSPNSHYLYVSAAVSNTLKIYQYDATLTDSAQFMQSGVLIYTHHWQNTSKDYWPQAGPDNKIYVSQTETDSLAVINYPNIQGPACNYQENAVSLAGNITDLCLPQFIQRYYVYLTHTGQCQGSFIGFNSVYWPPEDSIIWNFGDPGSGVFNFSNSGSPFHVYNTPGTYQVEFYIRHIDNRTDTAWQTVTILPSPHPALGADRFICLGDSATFDAGACAGCTYEWSDLTNNLFNIGNNQTYTAHSAATYMVTVTGANGCPGTDTVILATTPVPDVTNNPLAKSICSGDSTKIALTSNVNGSTFNWTATLTSGTVTGFSADSGHLINQVLINTGGGPGIVTYHIIPKLGSCAGNPVNYAVTVTPGIPVSVSITATSLAVCSGIQVTFSASPTNQGSSPVYLWKVNSVTAGTNSDTYTYAPANGDVIYCVLTSSNTLCTSNNPATSNSITMTVNPNLPVTVTVSASQNPSCAGTPVHFTAIPANGGLTPHYQWKVNGGGAGFDSTVYTYIPTNGDLVSVILTSSELCTTNNPASSIQYPASVSNNLPVSVTISTPSNPFCAGSSVSFTATPTNGGTTPIYLWKVNGINAGTNNSIYTFLPINGDLVSCTLTSSELCTTGNPASSIQVQMIENTGFPAGVTIAASSNPFCPGASVTFSATPTNGGGNPTYLWKVNGVTVGGNSSSYTFNPVTGDSVRCIMNSNLSCVTGNPASSAKIILSGTLAPIVSFTPCFDTVTTFNAKPIKLKGGIPLGGTYSGPGVNPATGVFTPSLAGLGTKTISYSYTNVSLCTSISHLSIVVSQSSFVNCGNPLTDVRDNKVYETVQIGTQCWFAEDLNYGTEIPFTQNQRDNCAPEYFRNASRVTRNAFYQWDELMQYDDTPADQGLCPPAWHVPTENDWLILFSNYTNNAMAGSPLKYSGYSGFNALLQGANHLNRQWDYPGFATFYWSSTSHGPVKAWVHGMNDIDPSVSFYPSVRTNAFSVRCIKD